MTRADRLAVLLRKTLRHLPPELRTEIRAEIDKPAHRPRSIDRDEVFRLAGTMPVMAIAAKLGHSRQAIHAVLRERKG